jgi:hypothetical protein
VKSEESEKSELSEEIVLVNIYIVIRSTTLVQIILDGLQKMQQVLNSYFIYLQTLSLQLTCTTVYILRMLTHFILFFSFFLYYLLLLYYFFILI